MKRKEKNKLHKITTIKAFSLGTVDIIRSQTCKDNCDESGGSYTDGPSATVKSKYQKSY